MPQQGKAALLSLPTCQVGMILPTPVRLPAPVTVMPLHTPVQILKLVLDFLKEKGIPLQRQNYVKLNSMNRNSSSDRSVPWLSLSGVWLENAGFRAYKQAKTIAVPGMLIIIPGHDRPLLTVSDARAMDRVNNKIQKNVYAQKISSVDRVIGAKSYVHEYTADPLTATSEWAQQFTTIRKCTLADLVPGQKYWFRVAAIGPRNQVTYTNAQVRMVA